MTLVPGLVSIKCVVTAGRRTTLYQRLPLLDIRANNNKIKVKVLTCCLNLSIFDFCGHEEPRIVFINILIHVGHTVV